MIEIIIITMLISTILNLVLKQFEIPTIIGYIATGTIITYGFNLHDAIHSVELKQIAEFGVVFLMFTIGLEFSVKHLSNMKNDVFVYGSLQVILTATFFSFCAHQFFGIEIKSAIIIGLALTLSSTAIVLKLLNESGDINKAYGRRVLGVLLFQDIAVIPILLMITIFSAKSGSVSDLLLITLVKAGLLFAGLFIVGKYLLEPFFTTVSKTKSDELFVGSILLVVIGASYVAHMFGFSYSLGAFVAGMMIAETHYKYQVQADLIPFRDLLLGIFFITVGMQLDFEIIFENIATISILLPVLVAIKIVIIYSIFKFVSSSSSRDSLKISLSIFQLGEFALVIFELAFSEDLLDPTTGQILIVVVVLTMIMTPFVLNRIAKMADLLNPTQDIDDRTKLIQHTLKNHIVLIGYGRLGKHISYLIEKNNMKFVAIEGDIKTVKDAQKQNLPVIFGNASQKNILESVAIKDAASIIISIGNSQKLHHVCQTVNELTKNTKPIVKVNKFEEKELLDKLNLTHIVVETEKTATAMFDEAMKCSYT